jgi:hypothetical protein
MTPNAISVDQARPLIERMVGEPLHAKQVESVTNAVVGVVHAVSLSIHAIGAGLAAARGLQTKHAIKQVDRLLSNPALDVWALFAHWVPHVVAAHTAIVVALDWTDFDAGWPRDDHAVAGHGARAGVATGLAERAEGAAQGPPESVRR